MIIYKIEMSAHRTTSNGEKGAKAPKIKYVIIPQIKNFHPLIGLLCLGGVIDSGMFF